MIANSSGEADYNNEINPSKSYIVFVGVLIDYNRIAKAHTP